MNSQSNSCSYRPYVAFVVISVSSLLSRVLLIISNTDIPPASPLLVYPCLSFPSLFLLLRHIPAFRFKLHTQKYLVKFLFPQVSPENKNSDKGDLNPHTNFVNVSSELSLDADNKENAQPSFSRKEIADHCSSQSCWMVINNRVYDVTRFLRMVSLSKSFLLLIIG